MEPTAKTVSLQLLTHLSTNYTAYNYPSPRTIKYFVLQRLCFLHEVSQSWKRSTQNSLHHPLLLSRWFFLNIIY